MYIVYTVPIVNGYTLYPLSHSKLIQSFHHQPTLVIKNQKFTNYINSYANINLYKYYQSCRLVENQI